MSAPQVIAVDLGGTKLAAGIVARDGAVAGRATEPTDLIGEEALLAQLERVIAGLASNGPAALGVGVPSTIDQRTGRDRGRRVVRAHGAALIEHEKARHRLRGSLASRELRVVRRA